MTRIWEKQTTVSSQILENVYANGSLDKGCGVKMRTQGTLQGFQIPQPSKGLLVFRLDLECVLNKLGAGSTKVIVLGKQ